MKSFFLFGLLVGLLLLLLLCGTPTCQGFKVTNELNVNPGGSGACGRHRASAYNPGSTHLLIACDSQKGLKWNVGAGTSVGFTTGTTSVSAGTPLVIDKEKQKGYYFTGNDPTRLYELDLTANIVAAGLLKWETDDNKFIRQRDPVATIFLDDTLPLSQTGNIRNFYVVFRNGKVAVQPVDYNKPLVSQWDYAAFTLVGNGPDVSGSFNRMSPVHIDYQKRQAFFGSDQGNNNQGEYWVVDLTKTSGAVSVVNDLGLLSGIKNTARTNTTLTVGQTSGVALHYDITAPAKPVLKTLFVMEGSPTLTNQVSDKLLPITYWGADNGKISKVWSTSAQVIDTIDLLGNCGTSCNSDVTIENMFNHPSDPDLIYALVTGDSASTLWLLTVDVADCSRFTDCDSCSAEQVHCGWCVGTGTCTTQRVCSSEWVNPAVNSFVCPRLTEATPSFSPIGGNIDITITGSPLYLVSGYEGELECSFGTNRVEAQINGPNSLTCSAPNIGTKQTLSLSLTINGGVTNYASNSLSFEYVDCSSAKSCSECGTFAQSAPSLSTCGWCFATDSCGIASACAVNWTQTQCPSFTAIIPPSADLVESKNLTLDGDLFYPGTYVVEFEGVANRTAVYVSSSALQVESPVSTSRGFVNVRIFRNGVLYSSTVQQFYYYSCSESRFCAECVTPLQPDCHWCESSLTCSSLSSGSNCTGPFTTDGNCMGITTVSPPSLSIFGGENVTLTFATDLLYDSGSNYEISVRSSANGNQLYALPAMRLSARTLTSVMPLHSVPGENSVYLMPTFDGTDFVEDPIQFSYYDCLLNEQCTTCINTSRPLCAWCQGSTGRCFTEGITTCSAGSSVIADAAACPAPVSTGPNNLEKEGDGSNNNMVIIIAVVVAGGAVIIVAIVAVILVRRRKDRSLRLPPPPDFTEVAFKNDVQSIYSVPKPIPNQIKEFEEALLNPDFKMVRVIASTVQATDSDRFAKSLIYVFMNHSQDSVLNLIKFFISEEVKVTEQEGTLFRSNSLSSKAFTAYAKVTSLEYLWKTIALPVYELVALGEEDGDVELVRTNSQSVLTASLETDVKKADTNVADFSEANTYQLLLTTTQIFNRIRTSSKNFPSNLRVLLKHVHDEVESKFPRAVQKAIGGFIFLRLICPSLISPQNYGLLREHPSNVSQRVLVLIVKLLQSLANESFPGNREAAMQKLDQFVTDNIERLHQFYNEIVDETGGSFNYVDVPETAVSNSICWLYNYVVENSRQIQGADVDREINFPIAKMNEEIPQIKK